MITTIFITLLGAGSILSRSAIRQDWLLHKFLPNELTEGFEAQDFGENLEQFSLKKRDGKPMELGADHRHGAEYDYLNQFRIKYLLNYIEKLEKKIEKDHL